MILKAYFQLFRYYLGKNRKSDKGQSAKLFSPQKKGFLITRNTIGTLSGTTVFSIFNTFDVALLMDPYAMVKT